jgi:hypothetical protein
MPNGGCGQPGWHEEHQLIQKLQARAHGRSFGTLQAPPMPGQQVPPGRRVHRQEPDPLPEAPRLFRCGVPAPVGRLGQVRGGDWPSRTCPDRRRTTISSRRMGRVSR